MWFIYWMIIGIGVALYCFIIDDKGWKAFWNLCLNSASNVGVSWNKKSDRKCVLLGVYIVVMIMAAMWPVIIIWRIRQ